MRRVCAIWLLLLLALFCPKGAPAALTLGNIDGLPSMDGDNLTSDSLTGFDWLDPSVTLGLSFDQVNALLGTPAYSEFRYATRSEVRQYFDHLGLPLPDISSEPEAWAFSFDGGAAYAQAVVYFGITYMDGYFGAATLAITSDGYLTGQYLLGALGDYLADDTATMIIDAEYADFDGMSDAIGSWLIRDTPPVITQAIGPDPEQSLTAVPEPSSLILWAVLGALGFAAGRSPIARSRRIATMTARWA